VLGGGSATVFATGTADDTTISGGVVDLTSGAITAGFIDFTGSGGAAQIDDGTAVPGAVISGFSPGDAVDFTFLPYSATDSYSVSGGVVTISAGGADYQLAIDGATAGGFQLHAGNGNELVFVVCYYPGTRIRTPAGDVPVESLQVGDPVVTSEGDIMPVRWIGRNTVSTRFADPLRVLPIRIRAGALAEGLPTRDLLVSPEHAVLVEDVLIQASALVNGCSIIREQDVPETFTYYHIELSEHSLILAEGTPAESFVDNIHRSAFDNWEEYEVRYGNNPIHEMALPRALSHRQVPAEIHARLTARAHPIFGRPKTEAA
jgi:hypothetical protein